MSCTRLYPRRGVLYIHACRIADFAPFQKSTNCLRPALSSFGFIPDMAAKSRIVRSMLPSLMPSNRSNRSHRLISVRPSFSSCLMIFFWSAVYACLPVRITLASLTGATGTTVSNIANRSSSRCPILANRASLSVRFRCGCIHASLSSATEVSLSGCLPAESTQSTNRVSANPTSDGPLVLGTGFCFLRLFNRP